MVKGGICGACKHRRRSDKRKEVRQSPIGVPSDADRKKGGGGGGLSLLKIASVFNESSTIRRRKDRISQMLWESWAKGKGQPPSAVATNSFAICWCSWLPLVASRRGESKDRRTGGPGWLEPSSSSSQQKRTIFRTPRSK